MPHYAQGVTLSWLDTAPSGLLPYKALISMK
jgi:hypothetical protein